MKKIFILIISIWLSIIGIGQTIELRTNGYLLKLNPIDTLFYTEYPLSSTEKINAKKNDFNNVDLKYSFGTISKTKHFSSAPSFTAKFYVYEDGTLQAPTSQLFLKPIDAQNFIARYKDLGKIEEHPVFKGFYYLYVTNKKYATGDDIFQLCNVLYNDRSVSMIEPVFIKLIKAGNPLRPWEWNINNNANVPGGIAGADMRVENAWCYSTGTNIRVAVIDDGVDLTHPDLQANLLPGFDATGNNSGGAPTTNNGHGTNCAGIIASVNNTIGTIGVAFNSRIIPLRLGIVDPFNGTFNTNDAWIANCFTEAVSRGADVISNSWGGGTPSAQIDQAISNAITNGRNGLGCVVLFAAGNINTDIQYPSSNANVIAVGASTPCDTRKRSSNNPAQLNPGVFPDAEGTSCDGEAWWGSCFGTGLDILAPGVWITTTDNVGNNGFVFGDYNDHFDGTSSACPNAAAVVALILSSNQNLTGQQARNLLEQNCFKIPNGNFQTNVSGQPNGTWSNQAGYGRVDAERCVRAALAFTLTRSEINTNCETITVTANVQQGSTLTWETTGGLLINGNSSPQTLTGNSVIIFGPAGTGGTVIAKITAPNCTDIYSSNYLDFCSCLGWENPSITWIWSAPMTGEPLIAEVNPVHPSAQYYQWYVNGELIETTYGTYLSTYNWPCTSEGEGLYVMAVTPCGTTPPVYGGNYSPICNGRIASNVNLYPNPASSQVTIILDDIRITEPKDKVPSTQIILKEITQVRVIDRLGVIRKVIRPGKGNKKTTINVWDLQPDIYYLDIMDDTQHVRKPLIIRR